MSDNKFILQLKGTQTPKSVFEIKNDKLVALFTGVPHSTDVVGSIIDDKDSSVVVAKGAQNWKLDGSSLVVASSLSGDGADYTGEFNVSGSGLWINAMYSLPTTIFSAGTKWALKLCGKNLLTTSGQTIGFTLVIKIGNTHITSKTFTVAEGANVFCRQLVIDFSESEQAIIKAQSGDSLTVQLLCSDTNASATIYNGMTVFTALQRRVDADVVASDKKTFDEVVQDIDDINEEIDDIHEDITRHINDKNNPHEVTKAQVGLGNCDNTSDLDKPISTATQTALDGKVNDTGDTLTGLYKHEYGSRVRFMAANSTVNYTDLFMNSQEFEILFHTSNSIYDGLYGRATNGYVTLYPGTDNQAWLGLGSRRLNRIFVTQLCPDSTHILTIPEETGILATKADVDLAANSGRMITDQGVWYAKMYAATVPPSAENGTNYADFSQVDGQGNPIIVTYNRVNGAWVQDQTITPPADYDGYVPITSKIWDIPEQDGQQGGRILWNHTSKQFTPYPQIVSFDSIEITGDSTVEMPQNPSDDNIANVGFVKSTIGGTRNIGDIFFTMRSDTAINGAVECDGATYNTTDFTGGASIGNLLALNKVPYVSLATYNTLLLSQGSCGVFGWDGVGTTAFRVPSLNDIFIETGTGAQLGDYVAAGLPNVLGSISDVQYAGTPTVSGALYVINSTARDTGLTHSGGGKMTVGLNASLSNTEYGNSNTVQPQAVRYRAMVQLATAATDEALETCTGILADVATLKSHEVIEFQAPTAANNYTWYRKYADGWIEQGGTTESSGGSDAKNITFPVEMANTNYVVQVTICGSLPFGSPGNNPGVKNDNTTTGMKIYSGNTGSLFWEVKGMYAQS